MKRQAKNPDPRERAVTATLSDNTWTSFQTLTYLTMILCLVFPLLSCSSETANEPTPPPEVPKEIPFVLEGKLQDVKPIAGVISLGGLNLISEASAQLREGLTSFLATPLELRSLWLDNYVQTDLLFGPEFVDTARPLRVVQVSLKGTVHTVKIIGVTDIKALTDSLGTHLERQTSPNGIIYVQNRYKGDKTPPRFIELGQGLIASTDQAALLGKDYLDYYRSVATKRVDGFANAIFYPQEASKLEGLQKSTEMIDQLELRGSDRSITRQRGMLKSMAALLKRVADDSESTTLSVTLNEPRVTVDVDWRLKAGSRSKNFIDQLSGGEHELIKRVGAAALILSLDLPEPLLSSLIQEWNKVALKIISKEEVLAAANPKPKDGGSSKAKRKGKKGTRKSKRRKNPKSLPPVLGTSTEQLDEYVQLVTKATKTLGGELLLSAIPVPTKKPAKPSEPSTSPETAEALNDLELFAAPTNTQALRWLGLFNHTNAEELSQDLQSVLDIYRDAVIKRAMKKRGLVIKIKEDPILKIGETEIKSTHIKTRMPRTPRSIRPLRPQLKELYDAHVAVAQDIGVVGFAKHWRDSFERVFNRGSQPNHGGESPYVSSALQAGVKSPTLFFYLDPITTLTSLKQGKAGSMLLPLQLMFAAVKATEGLSFSFGKSEAGAHARLNIPHKLLESIKSAMSGTPME